MKTFLLAIGATAVAGCAAPALTQAPPPPAPSVGHAMTRGAVAERVQARFARLDVDKDGFVTAAEQRPRRTQAPRRPRGQAQPGAMFTRLDTNRDGQVTRAEADAVHAARMQRMAEATPTNRLFERSDANRDGAITRTEFDAVRGQRRARTGVGRPVRSPALTRGGMLAMTDLDKDGRVSLQEATTASLSRFDSLDVNRDGTITPDERRQMRQQRRSTSRR